MATLSPQIRGLPADEVTSLKCLNDCSCDYGVSYERRVTANYS